MPYSPLSQFVERVCRSQPCHFHTRLFPMEMYHKNVCFISFASEFNAQRSATTINSNNVRAWLSGGSACELLGICQSASLSLCRHLCLSVCLSVCQLGRAGLARSCVRPIRLFIKSKRQLMLFYYAIRFYFSFQIAANVIPIRWQQLCLLRCQGSDYRNNNNGNNDNNSNDN